LSIFLILILRGLDEDNKKMVGFIMHVNILVAFGFKFKGR
jgi:hypothetical protein